MEERRPVIIVDGVSKVFKLPHEKNTSIKSAMVNFYRRKRGYELQKALDKINLEIYEGEFFGIVGRNGSGKSTLLKLLAGIYEPSTGAVHLGGTLTPFIELGVGFNPELTGRENVFMNGALLGFNRKEMNAMYSDIVDFAELKKFMDQKLKNYSSGMQVRLAFSIAIRAKSDILLIDEVLAVGDAAFQSKCFDYFRNLKKEKRTVVFVSHDMSSIQEFCDRALLIDNGKLQLIGKTNEVASKYLLNSAEVSSLSKVKNPGANKKFEFIKVEMSKSSNTYKNNEELSFSIHYDIKEELDYDIGISIQKNGVSAHERNTKNKKLPTTKGKHVLTWKAPGGLLTQGIYSINVASFTKSDFKLVAYLNDAASFFIEREDNTLGGIVDMQGHWEADK